MDAEIPRIFQPLQLRGRCRFRALQRHVFLPVEKTWACHHICNGRAAGRQRSQRLRDFARRYSLQEQGVQQWVDQLARGEVFTASVCRLAPPSFIHLDDVAVAALNAFPASRAANESDGDYERRFGDFIDQMLLESRLRLYDMLHNF